MSVIIRERERDRERDYDDRTSTYRREPAGYTTVKRYRVPAEEEKVDTRRTVIYSPDRDRERERYSERDRNEDRSFEETRIIRRERTPEPEPERRVERDIRIERIEREREPEPPRRFAEYRYERDFDRLAPRREPYELERYSRSTEYFPRPDPPQPIIIRQEPQQIIIQEAPRAPIVVPAPQKEEQEYQLIQRSEVAEDHRSVISKATTKREKEPQRDEEYYYERRTREVKGDDRDDDFYEERHRRREVSPGESVSQVGRRRGRDRDYSSDDSMVYVRRETRDTYERDESPDHRRHLAEGAIAGIGAAELLRHHRSRQGEEMSGTGSRIAKDLGAAGLGAVAARGISRARSHHREKSRRRRSYSRSRSSSRGTYREGRRRERRKKSKSRSSSRTRVKQLAGLGLGAAAVAAAVGYANRKNKANKEQEDRRSRSRTRRHSVGDTDTKEIPENDPRNPAHRNKKIAQAGLAGAAVAGLVERARSKSRGPDKKGRERSKSRVRTGLPIAAAGLGTAAIAGLYERSQANKNEKQDEQQAKVVRKERREARREARSRSRSVPYDASREAAASDPGLIEYGDQPVYTAGGNDYYNRPASQQGLYSPDAMVPAAAAGAAAYGVQKDRERERRRGSSSSGSDSRSKRRHRRKKSESRSRDRGRDLASAGLAAGAGAVAASEYEKRKQRKHEKRERRRKRSRFEVTLETNDSSGQEELREQAAFDESYPPQAQQQFSPIGPAPTPQAAPEAGYAPGTYYPPPPGQGYSPQPAAYPQEYPPPPGAQPHQAQLSPEYNYPQPTGYTPPVTGNPYDPPGADPYGQQQPGGRTRRADENVSAAPVPNTPSNAAKRYVPEEGGSLRPREIAATH